MNKRLVRFFLSLIVFMVLFISFQLLLLKFNNPLPQELFVYMSSSHLVYILLPLFAVLLVGKEGLSTIKQGVNWGNIRFKTLVQPFFMVAILFPLIIIGVIFVLGNICGLDWFGRVMIDNMPTLTIYGFAVPEILGLQFGVMFLFSFVMSILSGGTDSMLTALCGEIAWRGFLENKLHETDRTKKTVFIGLVWGLWLIPIGFLSISTIFNMYLVLKVLLHFIFYISCSFLCVNVLKKTGSLLGSALVMGAINSVGYFYLLLDFSTPQFAIVGGHKGLIAIFAILVINRLIKKNLTNTIHA